MKIKHLFSLFLILLPANLFAVEKHLEMDYGNVIHSSIKSTWPIDQVTEKAIAFKFENHVFPEKGTAIGKGRTLRERSKTSPLSAIHKYQREKSRGYLLNVPKGNYKVTLQFAEIKRKNPGERVFDILLQHKLVEKDLDILKRVGKGVALDLSYNIEVSDGKFQLGFVQKSTRSTPAIAGIIIEGKDYTRKINCGGKAAGDYEADLDRDNYMEQPFSAGMMFDTDLLRYSAAWSGGYLDLYGAAFDGSHGTLPEVIGSEVFSNLKTPGWYPENKDLAKDPRKIPYGPIDKSWGEYLGLYQSESGPILKYRVLDGIILEQPSVTKLTPSLQSFTREISIKGLSQNLTQWLLETQEEVQVLSKTNLEKSTSLSCKDSVLTFEQDEQIIAIHVDGENLNWTIHKHSFDDEEYYGIGLKVQAKTEQQYRVSIFKGKKEQLQEWLKATEQLTEVQLHEKIKTIKTQWPDIISTKGIVGQSDTEALVVDTITLPTNNPYNAWMRPGGFDFFKDGKSMAMSTWSGDVWIATGLDSSLQNLKWKRYASGLYQPLGLKIINEKVWVQCRDQIIRLHDSNKDGEADFYECMMNEGIVSENFHEFTFELHQDSKGRLYFLRGAPVLTGGEGIGQIMPHHGCLFRYDPKTDKLERVASGFRAPNGMSIGPNDEITSSDNEGNWVPSTPIHLIKEGGFYGVMPTRQDKNYKRGETIAFLPHDVDNSAGGQVWVPQGQWGSLSGELIHLSYGKAKIFHVLKETIDGVTQGGVVDLKPAGGFDAGIMRARFNPGTGHLYTGGLKGWQTSGVQDGGLYRVRYQEKKRYQVSQLEVGQNGIRLHFGQALDPITALDVGNYDIKRWDYWVSEHYGSKPYLPAKGNHWKSELEWAPLDKETLAEVAKLDSEEVRKEVIQKALSKRIGKESAEIRSISLAKNRKSVFLEIPSISPVMQMQTSFSLKFADTKEVKQTIYHTIHKLGSWKGEAGEQQRVEAPKNLVSGIKMTIHHNGQHKTDYRVSRFISHYQEEKQALSPFLDHGPFSIKLEGWIKLDKNSKVAMKLTNNGTSKLSINGNKVNFYGREEINLKKGYNRILLQFESPSEGDSFFRLNWRSNEFPWEPLPPHLLFHASDDKLKAANQLRKSRELMNKNQCISCHSFNQGEKQPESSSTMILKKNSQHWDSKWMSEWLQGQHGRGHCISANAKKLNEQDSIDIASFLCIKAKHEDKADLRELGAQLYDQLGCASCHNNSNDKENINLSQLKDKYSQSGLREFLLAPNKVRPSNKMPHFNLSAQEADALSQHLTQSQGSYKSKGDPIKGLAKLQQNGCMQCHSQVEREKTQVSALDQGCLALEPPTKAAQLTLTEAQKQDIANLIRHNNKSINRTSAIETSHKLMDQWQCNRCHRQNKLSSTWVSSQQDPQQQPPLITWAGEKLKPTMLKKILSSETEEEQRPWMKARMPNFKQHADIIMRGLTLEQGFNPNEEEEEIALGEEMIAAGKSLFGNAGFNCIICHGVEETKPLAPFGAPGINLTESAKRLRSSYYMRWMLNPQRVDPQTLMTKFSFDHKTTGLKNVLEGDAHKQFRALYEYITDTAKK